MFTANDGWGLISDSLLVTHNGGLNWFSVPIPDGQVNDQSEALFMDAKTAYLVVPIPGQQAGHFYFTSDGGGSWKNVSVPFGRGSLFFVDDVGFFLQFTATAVDAVNVTIFSTLDNGQTWAKVYPGDQQSSNTSILDAGQKTGGAFINVDKGWVGVAGQKGIIRLYRTIDTARDWTQQDIPAPKNIDSLITNTFPPVLFPKNGSEGLLPVDFIAADTGDRNRVFYYTADGGDSWSPGASVIDGGAYTFLDPKTGWVWGKRGLYFSNDGAQTWQLLPVAFGKSENATNINFVDTSNGWLVTTDSKNRVRIYTTRDGGSTWMAVNP